ncbi:MAG: hypothetical protein GXY41_08735 [Phycisphaerae bacterium]|nr:hypothetical protein [Phycisphaerae bacterium]
MSKRTHDWQKSAAPLVSRLKTDRRNALILEDPWSRAIHSMVNGWRIRLSRPPAKGNAKESPRPTWLVFARRGVGILISKKNHANQSDWKLWATRRMTAGSRYIPKAKRSWQSSPGRTAR